MIPALRSRYGRRVLLRRTPVDSHPGKLCHATEKTVLPASGTPASFPGAACGPRMRLPFSSPAATPWRNATLPTTMVAAQPLAQCSGRHPWPSISCLAGPVMSATATIVLPLTFTSA